MKNSVRIIKKIIFMGNVIFVIYIYVWMCAHKNANQKQIFKKKKNQIEKNFVFAILKYTYLPKPSIQTL